VLAQSFCTFHPECAGHRKVHQGDDIHRDAAVRDACPDAGLLLGFAVDAFQSVAFYKSFDTLCEDEFGIKLTEYLFESDQGSTLNINRM
jgi:hypothetical protein